MVHSKPPMYRVHLFGYIFAPKLMPTIFTLALLPILISLGFWQLHRAQQKQMLINHYQLAHHYQPLDVQKLKAPWVRWLFQPVVMTGHYDNDHALLLDNKIHQHQPGYHVITPLVLENGKKVLVNRGWIPLQDRKSLPKLPPIYGKQSVTGYIDIPNPKPFLLKQVNEGDSWPRRIQAIEIEKIPFADKPSFYPVVVLLAPNAQHGFIRDWQPVVPAMPPARHIAYAIQWFSLALTLLIIFIVVNLKRRVP